MTSVPRPSRTCTHPGCRDPQRPGSSVCATHHNAKWDTRRKRAQGYQSKEYYRERAAVMRDRGYCHLGHLGHCDGKLQAHHTQPGNHDRKTLAPLCRRHHMQLEQQGKQGELARELARTMREVVGC